MADQAHVQELVNTIKELCDAYEYDEAFLALLNMFANAALADVDDIPLEQLSITISYNKVEVYDGFKLVLTIPLLRPITEPGDGKEN